MWENFPRQSSDRQRHNLQQRFIDKMLKYLILIFVSAVGGNSCLGADWFTWQTTVGGYVARGDFGEDQPTTLAMVPVTATVKTATSQWKLTVPFITIEGPGNIDGRLTDTLETQTERHSGLGDIALQGKWLGPFQRSVHSWIDFGAKIKLPSADENRGLGTGSTDLSLFVEGLTPLGTSYLATSGGYRWRDSSNTRNTDLRDNGFAGVAWFRSFSSIHQLGIMFDWKEASVIDQPPAREWSFYHRYQLGKGRSITSLLTLGTTASSFDYLAGISYRF